MQPPIAGPNVGGVVPQGMGGAVTQGGVGLGSAMGGQVGVPPVVVAPQGAGMGVTNGAGVLPNGIGGMGAGVGNGLGNGVGVGMSANNGMGGTVPNGVSGMGATNGLGGVGGADLLAGMGRYDQYFLVRYFGHFSVVGMKKGTRVDVLNITQRVFERLTFVFAFLGAGNQIAYDFRSATVERIAPGQSQSFFVPFGLGANRVVLVDVIGLVM